VKRLSTERELPKRAVAFLGEGGRPVTRYRWIATQNACGFPDSIACSVAEVSTSSYYEWAAREVVAPSDADLRDAYLVNEIKDIHADSDESTESRGRPPSSVAGSTASTTSASSG
jgi:hypothetical protein